MALYLEIISGTQAGKKFPVNNFARLGSEQGDIILNDPAVASHHADVEKDARGNLVLVCSGDDNDLKINAHSVRRVLLREGVFFLIGNTGVRVIQVAEEDAPAHEESEAPIEREVKSLKMELLSNLELTKRWLDSSPEFYAVAAFTPPLSLRIIQGIQADTEWVIGWGPRSFGRETTEFRLRDKECPALAFTITPSATGQPLFATEFPRRVRVNGRDVETATLKLNDFLQIGDTVVQIKKAKDV